MRYFRDLVIALILLGSAAISPLKPMVYKILGLKPATNDGDPGRVTGVLW